MAYEIGLIGAGNMAEAIARGLLSGGMEARKIIAADVSQARRDYFKIQLGIEAVENNQQAADANVILLCVKPYNVAEALAGIGAGAKGNPLFISILAGISTATIESHLGSGKAWRIIRAMPNTPMLVGQGMVAIAPGRHASDADLQTARDIFQSAAKVIDVREDQIDAVTALSGSGPAYFFYLVEHMIQAGITLGLTPEQSHTLATQTALGAGTMMTHSKSTPQDLRKQVTTPNGTTHAAITKMETDKMGKTIVEAVLAAAARARELAGGR